MCLRRLSAFSLCPSVSSPPPCQSHLYYLFIYYLYCYFIVVVSLLLLLLLLIFYLERFCCCRSSKTDAAPDVFFSSLTSFLFHLLLRSLRTTGYRRHKKRCAYNCSDVLVYIFRDVGNVLSSGKRTQSFFRHVITVPILYRRSVRGSRK